MDLSVPAVYKLREHKIIGGTKRGHRVYYNQEDIDKYKIYVLNQIEETPHVLPLQVETSGILEEGVASTTKMPSCANCKRRFLPGEEYVLHQFEDLDGEPVWRPICKDGCDIDYHDRFRKLLNDFKAIRGTIDHIISQYE